MINAFKYTETLEEAGFSQTEAQATIKIFRYYGFKFCNQT